jgi:hypothetical protein
MSINATNKSGEFFQPVEIWSLFSEWQGHTITFCDHFMVWMNPAQGRHFVLPGTSGLHAAIPTHTAQQNSASDSFSNSGGIVIILLIVLILLFGFGGYRMGPGIGYYGGGSLSLILLIVLVLLLLRVIWQTGGKTKTGLERGGIPADAALCLYSFMPLLVDGEALRLWDEAALQLLHLSQQIGCRCGAFDQAVDGFS